MHSRVTGAVGGPATPDAWASSVPSYLEPRQVSSAACRDHRLTLAIPESPEPSVVFRVLWGPGRFL